MQRAISHASAPRATPCAGLAELKGMGVRRLVALRGDLPSGYGIGGEFHYASDLVRFIREECGDEFHVEVACYPRGASAGRSAEADLTRPSPPR